MIGGNGTTRQFNSFEEAKRFFREQIKRLHPDRGGDKEEFLSLLERYQEFLERHRDQSRIKVVSKIPFTGNYFFTVLDLTVEEIALGCKKRIKVPGEEVLCPSCKGTGKRINGKSEICGFCKGTGFVEVKESFRTSYLTCPYCKGEGYVYKETCDQCKGKGKIRLHKEVEFQLPLGLKQGDIIYIPRFFANTVCDVYVEVNVIPHDYFLLDGHKLIYKCRIPFWEVILNQEISIPTLEGEERIPSNKFLSGEPIVIKGRGPFIDEYNRGDLVVQFELYIPENIPKKAKDLILKAVKIIQNS
ncbi:MAG: hypothetical protein GXO57_07575 [Thermodesulfobacteria bacterium]|nr:hypothetical protein [Thermodesulfobacteriota bacterium]